MPWMSVAGPTAPNERSICSGAIQAGVPSELGERVFAVLGAALAAEAEVGEFDRQARAGGVVSRAGLRRNDAGRRVLAIGRREHDVSRLDVAVNDPELVSVAGCVGKGPGDPRRDGRRHRAGPQREPLRE